MERLVEHLSALTPEFVHATLAGILLLCGFGLPVPEDLSLIAAGYMAHLGVVNVHTAFTVCLAAVLAGDTMAFFLGRFLGARVLETGLFKRLMSPRKQMRVRAYFRKYGSKVIFVGRFLPGLRFSIFFSAGTLRLRPLVFFVYDALAALISVPVLVYLTWMFGEHLDHVIAWARRSEYGILVLCFAVVIVFAARAYRRRRQRVQPASAGPATAPLARAADADMKKASPAATGT